MFTKSHMQSSFIAWKVYVQRRTNAERVAQHFVAQLVRRQLSTIWSEWQLQTCIWQQVRSSGYTHFWLESFQAIDAAHTWDAHRELSMFWFVR